MKNYIKKHLNDSFFYCLAIAVAINAVVELLSRGSLSALFQYIILNPIVFLYNTLIILLTLSVSFLVKRRVFALVMISVTWLTMGIINGILLVFRVTPFTAVDFRLMKYGLSLATTYLNFIQIAGLIVFAAAVIVGICYAWKKTPKYLYKISYIKSILLIGFLTLLVTGCTEAGIKTNYLTKNFGNIANAYMDYGFPYCFSSSLLNTGINKPKDYSDDVVEEISSAEILKEQTEVASASDGRKQILPETGKEMPNIIFLQLESFFDPLLLNNITFSEDPVPHFRALKEKYSSGYLNVPSIGAGTANTEFEVITGMNLDFFGPGEYPYKTILQKSVCESIGFNLKELGYQAHAIHNNEGTFYDRHLVFSQLGFDSFTPIEYMYDTQPGPTGWVKDEVLIDEIVKSMNETQEQDFIYAISVQGHGAYPEENTFFPEGGITANGSGVAEESRKNQIEYYINQIHEMDQFIGDLTETLNAMDENYILVMYGDHLPSLGITEEELTNESLFQTQYVTSNNMDLPKIDQEVESYQLTAHIMNQLNLHIGTMVRYHQKYLKETAPNLEEYLADMQVLEYDMLYGEYSIYGGVLPFEATDIQMGVDEIQITSAEYDGESLIVYGKNFNEFSKVVINTKVYETVYLSKDRLLVQKDTLSDELIISIKQIGRDKTSLGETAFLLFDAK